MPWLEANGISAVPMARQSEPVSITGRGPQRSETAPAMKTQTPSSGKGRTCASEGWA